VPKSEREIMAFWITLVRGMLAVTLGVALVFYPDKSRPMLGNFMGMFWLVSGVISLRWGVRGERSRGFPVLAGVVGVFAGLGMLGRNFARGWATEAVFLSVLGLIILLTGLMHIFGSFRAGPEEAQPGELRRKRSWTAFILGLFEVVLGLVLVCCSDVAGSCAALCRQRVGAAGRYHPHRGCAEIAPVAPAATLGW
jgi:uncharacterized membrane protein HdeD (DUF308 family)